MIDTRLRYFILFITLIAKSAMLMIGKDCKNSYFSFLNVLVFQEGFYKSQIACSKKYTSKSPVFVFVFVRNTHLNLLCILRSSWGI